MEGYQGLIVFIKKIQIISCIPKNVRFSTWLMVHGQMSWPVY